MPEICKKRVKIHPKSTKIPLEEFPKPLSLSFRLLGGHLGRRTHIGGALWPRSTRCAHTGVLAGSLHKRVQAVVFATLAAAYLGETLESLAE